MIVCQSCGHIADRKYPDSVKLIVCRDCLENARLDYSLRSMVSHIIPERFVKSRSKYDIYYCPFHMDTHNPNLLVYDHVVFCTAGCEINGKAKGDVFDFVQEFYHLDSLNKAMEYLTGNAMPVAPERVFEPKPKGHHPTLADIERFHHHAREALPWFQSRHITPFTVNEKLLGMAASYGHSHTFRAGSMQGKTVSFGTRRYTVPNIAFGKVWYCKLRRDEAYTDDLLQMIDPKVIQAVREEKAILEERKTGTPYQGELSLADIKDTLFGYKYTQLPNPRHSKAVFNAERVLRQHGEDWEYLALPYVLIHEGEFKAMAMEDAGDSNYGYPSLSSQNNPNIAQLVQNVKRVVYVKDNDGTAGEQFANQIRQWIPNAEVITPPDGLKAADDVIGAGFVHQWMSSYGIEPVKIR